MHIHVHEHAYAPLHIQSSLFIEQCEVQCRGVCETVCTYVHQHVEALLPQLKLWTYDAAIDNNPREFVENGTLYQESLYMCMSMSACTCAYA